MKKCCCFCGKEIEVFPQYVLTIQKYNEENQNEQATQELMCHDECLEKKLFDERWLYLKYI